MHTELRGYVFLKCPYAMSAAPTMTATVPLLEVKKPKNGRIN